MAVVGCLSRLFQAVPHNYGNFKQSVTGNFTQTRWKKQQNRPRLRFPTWFLKKERVQYNENLTPENKLFVKEIVEERFGPAAVIGGVSTYQQSPLRNPPLGRGTWAPGLRRTGVIARKIGVYPMWTSDGSKVLSTLLQVVDNHVVRYIPPDQYDPPRKPRKRLRFENRLGCLVVGAESEDPQVFTKEYCGLFSDSGVMPKKILGKFLVSPEAVVQPGTPLYASHFKVGQYVDIRGKTVDRGFQGVMKRWGFKGMPASHGVTKTHRRPGNIGGGGEKARVWPGTKLPGHMGNRHKILRGVKILRINTKYNVIWVKGPAVAGETNSVCYIYDTFLPLKKLEEAPYFPTFYPEDLEEPLPDEMYSEDIHPFSTPTITFQDTK